MHPSEARTILVGRTPGPPEDRARANIDRLLTGAGWLIQNRDSINIEAGRARIRRLPPRRRWLRCPAIYRAEIPDCCFQNTLVRFKASPDVIPEYALYVFRAWLRAGEFRKVARWTTTMAHLGAERFGAMPFPLRPKASQQAIVEHLDASLSSIAHLAGEITRASARAARLRQAILKKAFEGKLVPQDPSDEPASVLLQRIRSTR